jgi:hypothetical protein
MQPHSRKSVSSAAFVSFEVELVFESCDLKDANGRGAFTRFERKGGI